MAKKVPSEISDYMAKIGAKGGKNRNLGTSRAREIGRLGALKRWGKKAEKK